ncbi:unnamed protein product [Rotaria sordida]|uniref:Uncharacterized protein n=1 Tax=Rotaria sordida TaxID=392033 RepID=A0A815ZNS7_9BILA|nr:unnamed protein product [Rotaria sordida]
MIRCVIRQMMGLALVPEQYVPSLFANLGQELNDSERDELIIQINSGMGLRTKRIKFRIAEQRTKELYDRFNNNQIKVEELLRGLSLFVVDAK